MRYVLAPRFRSFNPESLMRLVIRNRQTEAVVLSDAEYDWLVQVLSVDVPGAKYSPAFRNGWWDGKKRFFSDRTSSFPTGLLPYVLRENRERKKPFKIKFRDKREWPFRTQRKPSAATWEEFLKRAGFNPDPEKCAYQSKGIRKAVWNTYHGMPWIRGIIALPTGSGKTILACGIIQSLGQPRTLILCDRLNLLRQTRDVVEKTLGIPVGQVGGGVCELENVTVGTVQTIKARIVKSKKGKRKRKLDPAVKEWTDGVDLLIIDECHKVGDNEYREVVAKIPAYGSLGLSATPLLRYDTGDIHLVGCTGDVLYNLEAARLASKGLLAVPVIKLIKVEEPEIITESLANIRDPLTRRKKANERFRKIYNEGVVENTDRNRIIVQEALQSAEEGRPTMILVTMIRHGEILKDMLRVEGKDVEFIHGKASAGERQEALERFARGTGNLSIASTIFDEGIDAPSIRTIVLAGGGTSPIRVIQRIGRGMRVKEGDNTLRVIDFLDLTHESLRKQSLKRVDIYESVGYEIEEDEDV